MAFQPFKNVASQVLEIFAFDYSTGAPKTGDAANITAYVTIDGGTTTVLADTSATEKSSTNAQGVYQFDLAQGETNGDHLTYTAKSSTSNVTLVMVDTNSRPAAFGLVAGATNGLFIAGTNAATTITTALTTTFTGNLTGSVGSVTGLTASNLDATITSRMATYTQPTGFLAATFPAGTVANTTNITAGTITTVTNLTNAATAGDFTATMKTSIGTAVAASAVASVTGNVGGNVVGSVGSVAGNVGGNLTGSIGSLSATAKTNVEDAVWDATLANHLDAGSTGEALNAAGAAGDPWITALPGAYGVGSAGYIVGNSLSFTVAGYSNVNIRYVNNIQVDGVGTAGNPWGPV